MALDRAPAKAVPLHPVCQEELYDPGRDASINSNKNSILTPQRPVPDVRLGYAPTGQNKIMWGKGFYPMEWTSKGPGDSLEGDAARGGRSKGEAC